LQKTLLKPLEFFESLKSGKNPNHLLASLVAAPSSSVYNMPQRPKGPKPKPKATPPHVANSVCLSVCLSV
jgi:hypothetical protein